MYYFWCIVFSYLYLWFVIIVANHFHGCTYIIKCITIHKSDSLVFAIYMHQMYFWGVLYVFSVYMGLVLKSNFTWSLGYKQNNQTFWVKYICGKVYFLILNYKTMKLQLYIVYINDIVKSYILPLINHEPCFICILLVVLTSYNSWDLKTSSSKCLNDVPRGR